MPSLMQLVEKNTCALSKQLLREDLSQFITHNEHKETVAVDPHILNWIKSSCLIQFVKIITWKFISWSQGKFLVFAAGQSRTSRGNTCHVWSCFFVPANIGEEHVTHTKATLMRFHWCFLFLDRSAKVRLAGQEILELRDFVLSLPSPATRLESSVYVSHCMIVS